MFNLTSLFFWFMGYDSTEKVELRQLGHNCRECPQCIRDKLPCQECVAHHYTRDYEQWTCGNHSIDSLVKYIQPTPSGTVNFLEYVPYEQLSDIKYLARGGFGEISLATWKEGRLVRWDHQEERWERQGETKVVLKTLKNSANISDEFIRELDAYCKCASPHLISYMGLTQNPQTKDHAMIMEYAENGDLRSYLANNAKKLYWRRKLDILRNVIAGLEIIHLMGMVHRDFHTGNILQSTDLLYPARITDLGLSHAVNEDVKEDGCFGVLPYVAPEVLDGKPYTPASDIYSFGMILWEVATCKVPLKELDWNDTSLLLKIVRGFRPEIPQNMPECYAELIKRCWDSDPNKRPTAPELKAQIVKWQSVSGWFPTPESRNHPEVSQFERADDLKHKEPADKVYDGPTYKSKPTGLVEQIKSQRLTTNVFIDIPSSENIYDSDLMETMENMEDAAIVTSEFDF